MITIVTGASENHSKSLNQLLESIQKFASHHRCVVYDFGGLAAKEIPKDVILRKYDYNSKPSWHNICKNAGQYAWKPNVIHEVMEEFKGIVLWLDSGDLLHAPLENIVIDIIKKNGFYSPISSGRIVEWTHPGTLFQMRASSPFVRNRENRNGAIIGFDYEHNVARNIAQQWYDTCMRKEIISPNGSSRMNHRQDQSVLSIIVSQMEEKGIVYLEDTLYDITIHNDCD